MERTRRARRAMSLFGAVLAVLTLAPHSAPPAYAVNIVTNGGFETQDLTGWTPFGDTTFSGVQCTGGAPQGICFAFFGPVGTTGGISQLLNLQVGTLYFLTFAFQPDGGVPSSFSVSLGGVTLLSLTNPPGSGFQTFSFGVLATAATESLVFTFRDDPGFLFLDAVSVSVPEPGSIGLLAVGLASLLFMGLRRKTQ